MTAERVPGGPRSKVRALLSFLRRPALVVLEVASLATCAVVAATLPQEPDDAAIHRFAEGWPWLARVTDALGLHRIVTTGGFLAVVALALASLVAVQLEQWLRVRRLWSARPAPASFARAPYRREIPLASARAAPEAPSIATYGRLGILGSPIFHLGLLVVVLAALLRLLFFRDAMVRVMEGETLRPEPDVFEAQRGGPLSRPFAVPGPVRIEEVVPSRYQSGALQQITARLTLPDGSTRELAINAPLDLGAERLYLDTGHGLAALLEHTIPGGTAARVVYLEPRDGELRGRLQLGDGRELRLRSSIVQGRPSAVDVRLLRGGVLAKLAELEPGAQMALAPGESLRLVALPYWAQLRGSRDPSRPFFFAGLAIGVTGLALMFGFVRADSAVFVEGDKLVVALRPQRFAPLFQERFERICKEWEA